MLPLRQVAVHAESLDAYIAIVQRLEEKGSNHLAPCVHAHPRSYLLVRNARRVRVHTLRLEIVFTTPSLTPAARKTQASPDAEKI